MSDAIKENTPKMEKKYKNGDPNLERMADEVHQVWTNWMRYMLGNGFPRPGGGWIMNDDVYKRWQRQMNTPYAQLSEKEKESDREIARRYLDVADTEWM
jgi:hypothetical protein